MPTIHHHSKLFGRGNFSFTSPQCRELRVALNSFVRMALTAICSASGRATLTDARALLTREIQKIQKNRQGSCDAVVDISINEDGLYESSIAHMSNSLSRRVDFGERSSVAFGASCLRITTDSLLDCAQLVTTCTLTWIPAFCARSRVQFLPADGQRHVGL